MIKPDTLWSFLKRSEDGSELTVGRVCRALAGHVVSPSLDANERLILRMIEESNEWHTEALEADRARKKAFRERKMKMSADENGRDKMSADENGRDKMSADENGRDKMSADENGRDKMSADENGRDKMSADENGRDKTGRDKTDATKCPPIHPSVRPSVRPSVHPSVRPSVHPSTNRSVPVRAYAHAGGTGNGTERNGNGTGFECLEGGIAEAKKRARQFIAAVRKDQGAFFDAEVDAVTVLAAVTGDYKSLKRWRQLVAAKGEGAIRDEAFRFWREVSAGEDVENRGAALNKRLAALPDEKAN